MDDEDGVKGCFIYDWIGNASCGGAYQPPDMLDRDPTSWRQERSFTISIIPPSWPCPFGKNATTKPIKHAESSWRPRKHRDSPNEIPGVIVAMSGGVDSISEHKYFAYRPS